MKDKDKEGEVLNRLNEIENRLSKIEQVLGTPLLKRYDYKPDTKKKDSKNNFGVFRGA